jgi:cysteine-rich repeat protein
VGLLQPARIALAAFVATLGLTWSAPAAAACGDGVIDVAETCDDGDADPGDGCSDACVVEAGFVCLVPGQACDATLCETLASGSAVFLRGNYIEIGLNPNAAFGSGVAPPAGWHARSGQTPNELGFVSDPADSDWTDYHGDFFTPGTREEGWGIEVNGTAANNNRNGLTNIAGSFDVPACISAGACDALGGAEVTWTSSSPFQGVGVSKKYTLVDGGVFVVVEVRL